MTTDIEFFDKSVFSYLKTIAPDVVYAPTNTALQTLLKNSGYKDDQPWGCISFFRSPSFDIDMQRYHFPSANFGQKTRLVEHSPGNREVRYVHDIPVNFTYNVEIWAATAVRAQELAIKLISKIYMRDQVLEVPINPEGEFGRFHIINPLWVDNSDLEAENERGKIYRHTITFTIEGRLKLVDDMKTSKFCVPVDIYENY